MNKEKGIYTLANDTVYDQLIALLNSIEANYSKDIPVYVIPYDDNISRVTDELKSRPNVELFKNTYSIAKWEYFAQEVWSLIPQTANRKPQTAQWGRHKLGVHRKLCCFDGPFDRFVFIDADTILMQPLDFVFEKLNNYDFIVYDYQYKNPSHVYNIKSPILFEVFSRKRIYSEIFCTGFFSSRKGIFNKEKLENILSKLRAGEVDILYRRAPEQSLLNYMVMKSRISVYNFALELLPEKRTGNSVTSSHFKGKDHILFDKGNNLTYLHYIGVPLSAISKVCEGKNIDFPYRDTFLHYRYLQEPGKQPKLKRKPRPYNKQQGFIKRILKKISALSCALVFLCSGALL